MFRCAFILLTCLLAAVILAGQATKAPQAAPSSAAPQASPVARTTPSPAAPAAEVSDSQAVITLQGLCPQEAAAPAHQATAAKTTSAKTAAKKASTAPASKPCVTTITRAQLEKLIGALNTANQPVTPQIRRQFAQNYVELLTYADAAEKAGTDDANFAEMMRFVRLRTLASVYRTRLQEQYSKPSESEIEAAYNQNKQKYEEIKLARIFIPARNPSAQDKDAWEKKAAQTATEIHDRATKGEDLEKLQKEAYATLGLTISPPTTNLGSRRRGMLPQAQEQELFTLKPGEVSKLEQDGSGYTIYKVEGKDTVPLDKVKDEISRELAREKMDAKNKDINSSVHAELNENYFGPAAPPAAVIPPSSVRPTGVPSPAAQAPSSAHPATSPQPSATPAASPKR